MRKRTIESTGMLCLLALAALPALAQEANSKPPVYTYVAEWSVPRAQWGDYAKIDDEDKQVLDKLVADGLIVGYGSFVNLIHQEGGVTHGSWFSATSEGRLLKALEAIWARPGTTSPVLAASKHWDYILVGSVYGARSGSWEGGYLSVAQWDVKPGEMREYNEMAKRVIVPMFDKLVADGAMAAYGLQTEDYHTENIGRVSFYFTVPDADSLDKVDKALDDAFEKTPEYAIAFRSLVERKGHRDMLARVRAMTNK
jgi:hypothetical protein